MSLADFFGGLKMYDSWHCLSVEKGPGMISDEVLEMLRLSACDLSLKKWDKMHIENDLVSGIITTHWNTYVVGSRSGVLFRAQIDCEDGTDFMVNFLFNEDDLARGAQIIKQMEEGEAGRWSDKPGRIPVPEMYEFYNLRTKRNRLN
jgi:hypothetical protein